MSGRVFAVLLGWGVAGWAHAAPVVPEPATPATDATTIVVLPLPANPGFDTAAYGKAIEDNASGVGLDVAFANPSPERALARVLAGRLGQGLQRVHQIDQ